MSSQQIEALLERYNIDAEAMEGFFDGFKRFASSAGQSLLSAAPSIVSVAAPLIGTAIGGPIGGMAGAALGRLASGAISSATAPRPTSPAAGQLLRTITRPETMQALSSMLMGGLGRPNVQVGSTSVPVSAFTNLLSVLATQAEAEYNAATSAAREAVPEYMRNYAGEAVGDPAVVQNRAEALYELLERTPFEQEGAEAAGEAAEYYESETEVADSEYDAIDIAEFSVSHENF
jgi:hypothetical protein